MKGRPSTQGLTAKRESPTMVKYRGGSADQYFDKVAAKAEDCIEHKETN